MDTAPVFIEVIAPIPERTGLCGPCELILGQANLGSRSEAIPAEDLPGDWLEEYRQLSKFISEISQNYGRDVLIHIVDPRSWRGLWKSLQHSVHRYPTFIVAGKHKITGLDEEQVSRTLERAIGFRQGLSKV